jgi:AraC-like DNA-binding protein
MLFTKIGSSYSSSEFPERFSNQLYFSDNVALGEFTYTSSYSLKFVLSGYENYLVEGREMLIKPGQHLIVNNNSEVTTLPSAGKAISIFIAPETLGDVMSVLDSNNLDKNLDNFNGLQSTPILFHEKASNGENTNTELIIRRIATYLSQGHLTGEHEIDSSLFFQLSEALLIDQMEHSARLGRLNCQKSSTLQEQYKRLLIGWQYLNDHWNHPFSLAKTASASSLSPYHFHRLFKSCFSMTPYQYHLKIQMDKAVELLKNNRNSISEIAYLLGYNSTTSFGRAFKGYFGKSPSLFLR